MWESWFLFGWPGRVWEGFGVMHFYGWECLGKGESALNKGSQALNNGSEALDNGIVV